MNRKSIKAIEKILISILELDIITKGRDDNYFYDGYEMPVICDLVHDIEISINNISKKIISKYDYINWKVIESRKENDNGFMVLKLGKTWELADGIIKKELYEKLLNILEIELPVYYTNYCNNKHKQFVKGNTKEDNQNDYLGKNQVRKKQNKLTKYNKI